MVGGRRAVFAVFGVALALAAFGEQAAGQNMRCSPQRPTAGRPSPYDSTVFRVGGKEAKVCYSRPSARGRMMIGGANVPYGQLWRTGANEPTTLHLPVAATIGGVKLTPGSYSLYTIPGESEWVVILNRSTSQWGSEGSYGDRVRAQEVGRGKVKSERLKDHVETFTIHPVVTRGTTFLVLDWEHTRVRVPVVAAKS